MLLLCSSLLTFISAAEAEAAGINFSEDIEEEDEKQLESEMEHLITLAGEFYDREMERYEE